MQCEVCHSEIEDGHPCSMCEFIQVEAYRGTHPGWVFASSKEILRKIERERHL